MDLDLKDLNDEELKELFAAFKGLEDVLNEQEEKLKEGKNDEDL